MELILIVIAGIMMGAVNVGFFMLGVMYEKKQEKSREITVDDNNKEGISSILEWLSYDGRSAT